MPGNDWVAFERAMARQRADPHGAARLRANAVERHLWIEVNEHRRASQAKIHGWDQALATGQKRRLLAMQGLEVEGFGGRAGDHILKRRRLHRHAPAMVLRPDAQACAKRSESRGRRALARDRPTGVAIEVRHRVEDCPRTACPLIIGAFLMMNAAIRGSSMPIAIARRPTGGAPRRRPARDRYGRS